MTMTMMMMIMSWYFLLFCDNGTLNDYAKPSAFHLLCGWRWDEENVTSLVVIVKCHINNFDEWIPLRPFWHCGAVLTEETSLHRITTCKKKIKVWNRRIFRFLIVCDLILLLFSKNTMTMMMTVYMMMDDKG